jgi:hypothetical protein
MIVKLLPGRDSLEVKNRWYRHLAPQLIPDTFAMDFAIKANDKETIPEPEPSDALEEE